MTIIGDPDGTIWAGTYGDGLYRYKNGTFTHFSTANGLFDDVVFQIVDDRRGSLWMTCNRGIFRVARKMLGDLAEGRASTVKSESFGAADGMRAAECNGNAQPAGFRAHDGTLWFPTIKGAVSVHPAKLVANALPPPVLIDRLLVNREPVDLESRRQRGAGPRRARVPLHGAELRRTRQGSVQVSARRVRPRLGGGREPPGGLLHEHPSGVVPLPGRRAEQRRRLEPSRIGAGDQSSSPATTRGGCSSSGPAP